MSSNSKKIVKIMGIIIAVIVVCGGTLSIMMSFRQDFVIGVIEGSSKVKAARPVEKVRLMVDVYSAVLGDEGHYRYEGNVSNVGEQTATAPVVIVDVLESQSGKLLKSEWLTLHDIAPGQYRHFAGGVFLGTDIKAVRAEISIGNYAYGISRNSTLETTNEK